MQQIQIFQTEADTYKPSKELLAAINTALFLKRPLLLCGDPGTGKTECAAFVARRLNVQLPHIFKSPNALRFNTKSVSQSNDLFYSYDAVSHFGDKSNALKESFISFNALGIALLASNEFDPNFRKFNNYDKIETIKNSPCGSIVLIDEIDKAPRDFPNDLLSELEKPPFKFNIKELNDLEVQQNIQFPVFVIITSNSEKGLPDAFLRRCVFHNINFPGTKELLQIVKSNLKTDNPYFENVIVKFSELREKNLIKKPSTSELIDWIACLQQRNLLNSDICNLKYAEDDYKEKIIETLGIITKSKTDFETASRDISG